MQEFNFCFAEGSEFQGRFRQKTIKVKTQHSNGAIALVCDDIISITRVEDRNWMPHKLIGFLFELRNRSTISAMPLSAHCVVSTDFSRRFKINLKKMQTAQQI